MVIKSLGLLAAMLAAVACSQENSIEATEATTVPVTSRPGLLATTTADTTAYRTDADALAARVARDLGIIDPAVLGRIKNEYYARGRTLEGYATRYVADTTGRYAATKAANDRASKHLKTALTASQYKTYAAKQGTYYEGPYTAAVEAVAVRKPTLGPRAGPGVRKLQATTDVREARDGKVKYEKVKYDNGVKIKRRGDGSLKIRRVDGTKIKIDKDGHRTVKKRLF